MTAFKHPTLYAALSTACALAIAGACSSTSRSFGDVLADAGVGGNGAGVGDSGVDSDAGEGNGGEGNGGEGTGGRDSGSGDSGSGGSGNNDDDAGVGGMGDSGPVVVANPGCKPPATQVPITMRSAFPPEGRSASGADVVYEVSASSAECSVVECRLTQGAGAAGDWKVCGSGGGDSTKVRPFDDGDSKDEAKNGAYTIDIRERFDGASGKAISRSAYVHNSLDGVGRCPELAASNLQILAVAARAFQEANSSALAGKIASAQVNSPFMQFDFAPPIQSTYSVSSQAGEVEYLSLRRHFFLNSNTTMVLMKRVYESRRIVELAEKDDGKCFATTQRTHVGYGNDYKSNRCDAIAMNHQGFGVCLQVDDKGVVSTVGGNGSVSQVDSKLFYSGVDHFMWSRLDAQKWSGDRGLVHFSPKCFGDASACTGDELFLPDRDVVLR